MTDTTISKPKKVAIALVTLFMCSIIILLLILYHREKCSSSENVEKNYTIIVNVTDLRFETEIRPISRIEYHICVPYMHGALCILATGVLGIATIIYRLCQGLSTTRVKYIHLSLHCVVILLLLLGIIFAYYANNAKTYGYDHHHVTSWFTLGSYLIQFIVATFIFVLCYPSKWSVNYAGPIHDIFGIWLLNLMIICCISGVNGIYIVHVIPCKTVFNVVIYIAFCIILVILLHPYFDWDFVNF